MDGTLIIEEAIRDMALQNIKRFHIDYFVKGYEYDYNISAKWLSEYSENHPRLKIKYELRCSNCNEIIEEFDDIRDIPKGQKIQCEDCDYDNIIDLNHVYLVYYISEEYRKQIRNMPKKRPNASRGKRIKYQTPSSLKELEDMNVLKVLKNNQKYEKINYIHNGDLYISNGQVGAMGGNSKADGFKILT